MPSTEIAARVTPVIREARTFPELAEAFRLIFRLDEADPPPPQPEPKPVDAYKDQGSDYGLKAKGKAARERINAMAKDIISRVDDPEDLTQEEREVLLQYSGRGGTSDNSQFEYYTPTHVAEGVWDGIKANGFQNGNVLEPSCGAGVFIGTKPDGVIVSGNDLDPTSSKVAALLNPKDHVSNAPFEQVVLETPDNTFDAVVGNVPFGDARGRSAHIDKAYKSEKRLERYFILRSLDKLRPGGLCCFVVPTNIVGAKGAAWEKFRVAVSKKAEFLGAHKLPSKTFRNQGTDTVVDVIVLKKHPTDFLEKIEDVPFETLKAANVVWEEFVKGLYWQGEGRRFIMGTYTPKVEGDRWSRETVDGDIDDAAMKQKLAAHFDSRIDWKALDSAEPVVRAYSEGDRKVVSGVQYELRGGAWEKVLDVEAKTPISKEKFGASSLEELQTVLASPKGALSLNLDQALQVFKSYPEAMAASQRQAVEFAISQGKALKYQEQIWRGSIIGGMIGRMGSKAEAGEDVSLDRAEIQDLVVSEIQRYGHPQNNKGLVLTGEGSRAFGLFKNAMDANGNFSDLLAGTLDKSAGSMSYRADDVQDIVSHLFVREGREDLELEDIKALYSGKLPLSDLGDLAEIDGVAISPDGHVYPMGRYCAGDIYPKVAAMNEAMAHTDDERLKAKWQEQIEEINRRRTVTRTEDVSFGLQQKWFSPEYVVQFLKASGYSQASYGEVREVEGEDYTGKKIAKREFVEDFTAVNGEFVGLPDKLSFEKQFLKYLNGGKITSSKEELKKEYIEQALNMERQFQAFMQQHEDIEDLAAQYNRQFNAYVPFEYEGDPLGIDEYLSGHISPHSYQNGEVRRLSEQGSGICGFNVGLGKTTTALSLAAYNHKRDRARRTCIPVPSSVLENWYHEARAIYSDEHMATVFFVGLEPKRGKDGTIAQKPVLDEQGNPKVGRDGQAVMQDEVVFKNSKEDVFEAMWKIPQSNFRVVVMTKEKFAMIPLRPETKQAFTDMMVERALMSEKLADKVNEGSKKGKSYQDDKDQANLEQKYSDEGTRKAEELPYLEDMGFDSIIPDECHFYKNSIEPGKDSQGIAYLPTAPSAQIAIDMSMKAHFIRTRNNGRGVYGLSATPVTNSPFEIFNMLSLVCPPEEFERFGVRTVDDFVRVFGDIQPVQKLKVNGETDDTMGLVGFKNLDGLRNLFHKYVNLKTVKDVGAEVYVPEADEADAVVPMNVDQEAAYVALRKEAKDLFNPNIPKDKKRGIFAIIRDMDRVTTDMDLYNHTMTFVFQDSDRPKVEELVKGLPASVSVKKVDEDSQESITVSVGNGAQIVDDPNETFHLVVSEEFEDIVVTRFRQHGIDVSQVAHPLTPKYAAMIDNLRADFETGGKQIIFTEEKTQHQKIARIIVNHLPVTLENIAIINAEEAAGDKLDKISKAYNSGKIKIIIANKKAEVGVNLQKGTTAIHHLTLPWTPASINQRNGRGVRQGNNVGKVKVYYYCGKGSFDLYRKELLQAKSNWINDLFTGTETKMTNGDANSIDELLDLLAENPEEARRQRREREEKERAKREEQERRNIVNKLQVLASNRLALDGLEGEREETRASLQKDIRNARYKVSTLTENGAKEDSIKRAQDALDHLQHRLDTLDARIDERKAKYEARIKMTTGLLRQYAKDGSLPFDPALIDRPTDCVVSMDGRLFAIGDVLEEPAETLKFEGQPSLVKIVAVEVENRQIKVEPIVLSSHSYVSRMMQDTNVFAAWKAVSYSEKELALKKVLSNGIGYGDLPKSGLDAQTFKENVANIPFTTGTVYAREGEIKVQWDKYGRGFEAPKPEEILWPEPQKESFRKGVCVAYLELVREGNEYYGRELMKGLFGPDYARIAQDYGAKALEQDVRAATVNAWNERKAKLQVGTPNDELYVLGSFNSSRELQAIYALGDNRDEIAAWARAVIDDLKADAARRKAEADREEKARREAEAAQRAAEQAAKDAAELESIKNNPSFREAPKEIADAFLAAGITLKYNVRDTYLPGFKGRRGTDIPAFGRLFMNDKSGQSGVLYRFKEVLKARFQAQFTSNWDEHAGAWWHVPASTSLEDLKNILL